MYLRNYTDDIFITTDGLLHLLSKRRRRLNFDCEQEINVPPSSSINSADDEFIVDGTHSTHSSAQNQIKEDDFTELKLSGSDQSLDPFEVLRTRRNAENSFADFYQEISESVFLSRNSRV